MTKRLAFIFGCLILVLVNQQCTQQDGAFSVLNSPSTALIEISKSSIDGGNGQHYGGKPTPGLYVRPLVENICGGSVRNLAEINVTDTRAVGKIVDLKSCKYVDMELNLSDFEFASYQQGRIGYLEGIYLTSKKLGSANSSGSSGSGSGTGSSSGSGSGSSSGAGSNSGSGSGGSVDSKNIEEVWCREEGSSVHVGFDVVIKADYQKKIYMASAASSKAQVSGAPVVEQYAAQSVSRRFEDADRVRYDGRGFDLEIRRRDYNSGDGTMTARFKYDINGHDVDMNLRCRLGGELDIMIPKK